MGADIREFRVIPAPVQAVQLTLLNLEFVADWVRENDGAVAGLRVVNIGHMQERGLWIGSIEGVHEARLGDWIVKDHRNRFEIYSDPDFWTGFLPTELYQVGSIVRQRDAQSFPASP